MFRAVARAGRTAGALVVVGLLLSACAAAEDAAPAVTPTPPGSAYEVVPEPGRTIEAAAPTAVPDLGGYRIAVVIPDDTAASLALRSAVRTMAEQTGAQVSEFQADAAADDPVGDALARALAERADIVVGLGDGVVDVFGVETAAVLDQQFLVIGAQLAEPTENVTSVIWEGATSRGSAAGADGEVSDDAVTEGRGEAAVGAGIDTVLRGVTGVVLRLE